MSQSGLPGALPVEKYGFVHHMLYPAYARDPRTHADTVLALARREDIGCMDFCLPMDAAQRQRAIEGLSGTGKQLTYVNHLFPARKISLGTADAAEQHIVRVFLQREVEAAAACGASQFLFVSGIDVPEDHAGALERFGEVTAWLCGLLAERGMTGIIEPLDTGIDKRFLLGSTADSCAFVERLGLPNLALEVDMGHIPCLFEEFESSYRRARGCLGRVHLSSCVLQDPLDPMFGDRHPSFFHPAGHLHQGDLARVLRVLREIGYFAPDDSRRMLFEVNPLPGEDTESCIAAHLRLLRDAWQRIDA